MRQLSGYFSRPSVHHYLVVDPDQSMLFHHARGNGDMIATRFVRDGVLRLDPPGIELSLSELFQASW